MKTIHLLFPTAWDHRQLEACRALWSSRFDIRFGEPTDEDCADCFDVPAYVEHLVATIPGSDGIWSASDYPGAVVAAEVATRLGLPGPRPAAVLSCSHKFESRVLQRAMVPDATPAFAAIQPPRAGSTWDWIGRPLEFPCFVKPAKGAFSVLSGVVRDANELGAFVSRPCGQDYLDRYLGIFHALVRRHAPWMRDARLFIAEELLCGDQVTVEGFVVDGQVEFLGIVDSVMHPGTRSFQRFEYPSCLPDAVKTRMYDIVKRCIPALGLDRTLFNVEMIHDPSNGRVSIIEINPRMCGQFADLYEKVDGTNSYEIALALAAGQRPVLQHRKGLVSHAASFPLRVFEPVRVVRGPGADELRTAEALFPGTLVWMECQSGDELSDFESVEDGCSARYGVVNLGGNDRQELLVRAAAVQDRLGVVFEPLTPGEKEIAAAHQGGVHGRDDAHTLR